MSKLNATQILIPGKSRGVSPGAALEGLRGSRRARPFDSHLIEFVGAVSRALLLDPSCRVFPELVALGHWFRPASLKRLANLYHGARQGKLMRARGVVFHLAPSNVDSVFIYSWFLSLLCGNANIIRVSRNQSEQMDVLLRVLDGVISRSEYASVYRANLVLTYGHDDEITLELSRACNLRVIWGGDVSVAAVRSVPLPARSTDLTFANRTSLAIFRAEAISLMSADELAHLVAAFYNDTFWFGQQACSSPRSLIWFGSDEVCACAATRFWPAFERHLVAKQPAASPVDAVNRLVAASALAASGQWMRMQSLPGDLPMRARLNALSESSRTWHCGTGIFWEVNIDSLDRLEESLTQIDQTVVLHGFEGEQRKALCEKLADIGVDRVVPPGYALEFSTIWDGVDFFERFSRETVCVE